MRLKDLNPSAAFSKALRGNAFIGLAFAVSALAFAVYYVTLDYPFVLDDHGYIAENAKIRSLRNLWPPYDSRYFGFASFAVNYYLSGLNPMWFRATNIVIHIMNSCLVFLLVRRTIAVASMDAPDENTNTGAGMAAITALIFALHPIQTQSVAYITQRFASLAALFYLASLVLFIRFRAVPASYDKKFALYALSILFAVMAQKTKEISFTLPAVIVLYDFMFFGQKTGLKNRITALLPFILCLAIVPLGIFGPEIGLGAGWGEGEDTRMQQFYEFANLDRYGYLITQFRVIVKYLRLLVLPVNQSMHYGNRLYTTILEPGVFLSLLLLLFMAGASVWLLALYKKTKNIFLKIIPFGVFWFFITISIESSVVPIKDVIVEHRLYLPSIGIFIVLAAGLTCMLKYLKAGKILARLFIAVIIAALCAATYYRNLAWASDETLWKDAIRKFPENIEAYNNLAIFYNRTGLRQDAIKELKNALKISPNDAETHNNLAIVYGDKGDTEASLQEFKEALRLKPKDSLIRNNIGEAYEAKGMITEAIEEYKIAAAEAPRDYLPRYNIANAYLKKGLANEAEKELKEAIRLKRDFMAAHKNLALLYKNTGRIDEAIKEYEIALQFDRDDEFIHNDIGGLYAGKGLAEKAIDEFREALRIKKDFIEARKNLAIAYHDSGRLEEAILQYLEVLKLAPGDAGVHNDLGSAYEENSMLLLAIEEYNMALKLTPENALIKENLTDLTERLKAWKGK